MFLSEKSVDFLLDSGKLDLLPCDGELLKPGFSRQRKHLMLKAAMEETGQNN